MFKLVQSLAKVPAAELEALLPLLDPTLFEKLSTWLVTFIDKIIAEQAAPADTENDTVEFTTDFHQAMRAIKYLGSRISLADLENASRQITAQMKLSNEIDGIMTAISFMSMLTGLGL